MSLFNLPRWPFNLLICVALIGCSISGSAASDPCFYRDLQGRLGATEVHSAHPPVIQMNEEFEMAHKVTDVKRLKRATQVLNIHNPADKTKLAGLPDGRYLYVMDAAGHTAILNRTMDPGVAAMRKSNATFAGSHIGLAMLLENEFKTKPQLLATGEILIRSGQVKMVSNGSGTFRGKTENLTYAVDQLHSMGLAVDAKTRFWDYSTQKYPNPHGESVMAQVRDAVELEHDPHLRKIWDTTRQVLGRIDREFEDTKGVRVYARDPSVSLDDKELIYMGIQYISAWRQFQDDEGFIVRHHLQSMGEEQYLRLLKIFSEIPSPNATN